MKHCNACGTEHPRDAFGKSNRTTDRLMPVCKASERARIKAYRSTERGRRSNIEATRRSLAKRATATA